MSYLVLVYFVFTGNVFTPVESVWIHLESDCIYDIIFQQNSNTQNNNGGCWAAYLCGSLNTLHLNFTTIASIWHAAIENAVSSAYSIKLWHILQLNDSKRGLWWWPNNPSYTCLPLQVFEYEQWDTHRSQCQQMNFLRRRFTLFSTELSLTCALQSYCGRPQCTGRKKEGSTLTE